jgi:DDE superfamily endonuclease
LIANAGLQLEFLPPYSPDYNPIEYSFSVLKRHLKNHDYLSNIAEGDEEEFAAAILNAAEDCVTAEIARNQFRHCGFRVQ